MPLRNTTDFYGTQRENTERSPGALVPFAELDALIAAGYGDTPQDQIPKDWRKINKRPRRKQENYRMSNRGTNV